MARERSLTLTTPAKTLKFQTQTSKQARNGHTQVGERRIRRSWGEWIGTPFRAVLGALGSMPPVISGETLGRDRSFLGRGGDPNETITAQVREQSDVRGVSGSPFPLRRLFRAFPRTADHLWRSRPLRHLCRRRGHARKDSKPVLKTRLATLDAVDREREIDDEGVMDTSTTPPDNRRRAVVDAVEVSKDLHGKKVKRCLVGNLHFFSAVNREVATDHAQW